MTQMYLTTGPPGAGKSQNIIKIIESVSGGVVITAETNAASNALANTLSQNNLRYSTIGKAQAKTANRIFLGTLFKVARWAAYTNMEINDVILDECFTAPLARFLAVLQTWPEARYHLLGDENRDFFTPILRSF